MPTTIGSYLAPRQSSTPVPRPTPQITPDGQPAIGPQQGRLQQLMQDPRVFSFLAQTAAGLLASQGFGEAASGGLGAMGRFTASEEQRRQTEEQETRRRFEADRDYGLRKQAAARAGKGSGGGGSSDAKFLSRFDAHLSALQEGNDPVLGDGMTPTEMQGLATMLAMRDTDRPEAYVLYSQLTDPDQKAFVLHAYAGGQEAGDSIIAEMLKPTEPSDTPPSAAQDIRPLSLPDAGDNPGASNLPVTPPVDSSVTPLSPQTPATPTADAATSPSLPQIVADEAAYAWEQFHLMVSTGTPIDAAYVSSGLSKYSITKEQAKAAVGK